MSTATPYTRERDACRGSGPGEARAGGGGENDPVNGYGSLMPDGDGTACRGLGSEADGADAVGCADCAPTRLATAADWLAAGLCPPS